MGSRPEQQEGTKDIYMRLSSEDEISRSEDDECSTSWDEETPNSDESDMLITPKSHLASIHEKQWRTLLFSFWKRQWFPEGPWEVCGMHFLDVEGVKLFKFFFVTISSILLVHYYAIFVVSF